MKKLVILLLFTALAGGGYWYARIRPVAAQAPKTAERADRRVTRAEKRDIDLTVEISGDVAPEITLDVKSEVGGKIKGLHIEAGAVVKEGDLLVEIDDHDLLSERETALAEIEGTKLQVDRDKKNFTRGKDLFEAKLISLEVFDNLSSTLAISENSYSKAMRKLQLVDDRLSKTKVLAPMAGTVLTRPVSEGQVVIAAASVNSGTTLMTIANLSRLLVETHINQIDVARIELNQVVQLRAESLKDSELEARIIFIAPVASIKTNVKGFQVRALIEKPVAQLRPGMTVSVKVPIARADDAIAVPIAAVFKGDGMSKVVYVRSGESSEKRQVKVGVTNVDYAQILTGLKEGEEILMVEPSRTPEKKS
ncbi:MAG: Efflux transporter, family, subunit [Chthoniobacteraceae bacterium]|nr:Efflux transporter, family, subunit [Chthoniobacteraceae bacterium]